MCVGWLGGQLPAGWLQVESQWAAEKAKDLLVSVFVQVAMIVVVVVAAFVVDANIYTPRWHPAEKRS